MVARRQAPRSSGITLKQLNRSLERGDIDPVYVVLGEEAFLRRRAIEALVAVVAAGDDADLALERIDGSVASMAEILDAARSLPLFLPATDGPVRVVLVRAFDPGTAADGELLGRYLDAPVEATCLVFEAAKLDSRRAATKLLSSRATNIDCKPPEREADVRRWIESSVNARGFAMDPEAVTYLLEMVGLGLEQLHQELDKVELFAAEGERMAARDLEKLLGRSREHSVFELTDALVAGRSEAALQVLNKLLDDGEEPVRILAMVSWVTRQLITARDLSGRGCPERELLQQLGGRWDQRRLVLQKAEQCDLGALENLLVACSQSDAAVKMQRGAGSRGTLERLCRRVCAA
jgi:DNA polymerase-3 subunit delta